MKRKESIVIGRRIEAILSKKNSMSPQQVVQKLTEEGINLEEQFKKKSIITFEIKRRIIESKIMILLEFKKDYDTLNTLFNELRQMGYSNFERELHFEYLYAKINSLRKNHHATREISSRMLLKIRQEKTRYPKSFLEYWIKIYENITDFH